MFGPKGQLDGGRNVRSAVRGEHRYQPVLVLDRRLKLKIVSQPKVSLDSEVILIAAVGNEIGREARSTIAELERVS